MVTWAAQNAVVTLLLAIVVALLCHAGRLSPASRHALWLVVLLKLVTPPFFAWPLPLLSQGNDASMAIRGVPPNGSKRDSEAIAKNRPSENREYIVRSERITVRGISGSDPASDGTLGATGKFLTDSFRQAEGALQSGSSPDWALLLQVGWLAGTLAIAVLQAIRLARMQRRVRRAANAPAWLHREVVDVAARLRIRPPRVVIASGIASPLVWAWGRATLVWPRGLVDRGDAQSWRGVIVHELAHLRRRDHWTGWLELAAGCLWWWSPVYWYARCSLRENAELACDAWVVRTLPDGRRSYAEALLAVCEFDPETVPPLPALGVQSGGRRAFERRLTMILRERLPVRVSLGAWIAVALLAAVAVPNWYLIARAQDVVDEADPLPIEPATPELPPVADALLDEIPPAVDILPVEAEPRVRVPDGGVVLLDPLPSTSAPVAEDAPASESTPQPALPQTESRSDLGRGGFGSRSFGSDRGFGDGAVSGFGRRRDLPARGQQPTHVVESDSFTFTRTTYRVPRSLAENLNDFLGTSLSWPHLMDIEMKSDVGEDPVPNAETLLTVTASPSAQEVIGNLIGLMLESKPRQSATPASPWSELRPTDRYEPPTLRAGEGETGALRGNAGS